MDAFLGDCVELTIGRDRVFGDAHRARVDMATMGERFRDGLYRANP